MADYMVCQWALLNACIFAAADIAMIIIDRTSCTKSTWLFRCVGVTDAAAAELSFLLYVELGCSAAAALAATLHMLLTTRTSRWAAAVDYQLAWVALAAAAGIHCMQVASDRIYLAADAGAGNPKHIRHIVEIVLMSLCLVADLLSGLLLCFSPRPRLAGDGEQV